ncbi:stellacyanin-like [Punica granatum]|uniref:Stellacyanin-like n=1 Tax=Punica granatum TaxID=22663 RepID=A0A6P8DKV3_PUNGR|nr:stellacyanin-like [Punica granatum]
MIHKGPLNDIAVFKYTPPNQVFKVNQTGFQYCIKPPVNLALTAGNDVIKLVTPGKKCYICGVGEHCILFQQKLAINACKADAPAPAPTALAPTLSSNQYSSSAFSIRALLQI